MKRLRSSELGCLAIVVVLVGNACAIVSPVAAESLNEALGGAYGYNPRLDAQRAFLRGTDEDVAIARSGYRPTIMGRADGGIERTDTVPTSQFDGVTKPHGYGVDLVQPIFRGFQVRNAVNAAEATVRSEREGLRNVERQVLLEAVTAYMDVVRDQQIVRLSENNVNVLTRELNATNDRFSVGEVTRTDVAQAEARRAGAVSDLDLARANLRTSRGAFQQVIGHPPSNLFDPGPPERFLPGSLQEAIDVSNNESPLVVAALYREQAAGFTIGQIRGELLPSFQIEAGYDNRQDISKTISKVETSFVTGRLTVPFYQGGEVSARVRQAKQNQIGFLQQIEQVRSEEQQIAVAAWSQLVAARAQLESDQIAVESNKVALQGVREEERVGQRTLLDVLNAEQEYLNSQVSLETTKRNLVVAAYTVIAAMGRLDAAWIGVAAYVYDPEVHYHEVRNKWFGLSITHGDGRTEQFEADPAQDGDWAPVK